MVGERGILEKEGENHTLSQRPYQSQIFRDPFWVSLNLIQFSTSQHIYLSLQPVSAFASFYDILSLTSAEAIVH